MSVRSLRSRLVFTLTTLGLLLSSNAVFAIQFVVEYALPRGATRGTTVEVAFYGKHLAQPQELVSNRGGIKLLKFEGPSENKNKNLITSEAPQFVTAKLEIALNCPLGEHQLSLRTSEFLAEPVLFFVGTQPIVNETEQKIGSNDSLEKAERIPLNSTIHGQIHGGSNTIDHDFYAFEAKAGQRLSIELEAVRLGTTHMGGENDCALRLYGPDGKVIAVSDDTPLLVQDPLITTKAPIDGRYVVEVAQLVGSASTLHTVYRLHAGTFPRPTTVYPLGGSPGEKLPIILQGDGLGPKNASVTLPDLKGTPGPIEVFEYFPEENNQSAPSPLPLRITAHRNILETEPNDTLEQAKSFTIPSALNGVIQKPGDVDLWKFRAEKDQAIDFRVFARTLGTPLDPKVWIRPARPATEDERPLAEVDDATLPERGYFDGNSRWQPRGVLDPALTFRAKESGEYILGIEDTRGLGKTDFIYRIEVDPHTDSMALHPYVPPGHGYGEPRGVTLQIPQGNRWTTIFRIEEGLGTKLKGEIQFEAIGLPAGVTMHSPKVDAKVREVPLQFIASNDAKPGISWVQILARPVDSQQRIASYCQKAMVFTDRRGGFAWRPTWTDRLPFAVINNAPFHLEMEQPPSGLTRNGELELTVKVVRHGNWNGPLEVKPDWVPAGIEHGGPIEVAPGQTTAKVKLRAKGDAALATWKFCVFGSTLDGIPVEGSGCRLASTPFVDLTVSEPFVSVTFQRASVEKGAKGQITAELKQHRPFNGSAKATLNRLPTGVKLLEPFPQITSNDKTCVFQIEASSDALTGQFKDIQAEISVTEAGQIIRQQSGSGVLRIDAPRGK